MIILLPIIISILCFALIPGRIRANRTAAKMLELQAVAAMTEDMKAAYWEQKRIEAKRDANPGFDARAILILLVVAAVIAYGIYGGNG
jgi:hypothetical protein